jgi:hypothetical protein
MANIIIGKFEVGPQSGGAGSNAISHRLLNANTGRGVYQKQIRASITNSGASANAIETLTLEAKAPFLDLDDDAADVSYAVIEAIFSAETNAEKFRISSTATSKNVTLKANTGYSVSANVGIFTASEFGIAAQENVSIKVGFTSNATAGDVTIPILVEYWDGSSWQTGGTFTITQATQDSTVEFSVTPATLDTFIRAGEMKSVSVICNVDYTIEKQGGVDTSWLTLSAAAGQAEIILPLNLTAAAQAVGAAQRSLNVVFKSLLTNSTIGTLTVTQEAGEAYAIAWQDATLSFLNSEVNQIKTNTLTCNANYALEEAL